MIINQQDLDNLKKLRQQIHQNPELSGQEKQTPERIIRFLQENPPDEIIRNVGGNGIILVYDSGKKGPNLLFRCELDALPITEISDANYRSQNKNVAHVCGHDGHMTIITGLGLVFGRLKPPAGKIYLLFQPAEETGEGAWEVVNDPAFKKLKIDYGFGLHNLPGFQLSQVVLIENNFAAASRGITIALTGKTSHAAEPENGINPALAVAEIITSLNQLVLNSELFEDFILITPVHVLLGSIAFGTSAGQAELRFTLRAFLDRDMKKLMEEVESIIHSIADRAGLQVKLDYCEIFPATTNDPQATKYILNAAEHLGLNYIYKSTPFRWSEDFGHYKNIFKTCFFGIGAGDNHPDLHNPDYDFPDELILKGIEIFYEAARQIWQEHNPE